MVGRNVTQQPATGDNQNGAGSRFRRKLSHGLASISNTLSARKTTPGRHLVNNSTVAVNAPATSAFARQCDAPLSPTPKPRENSKRCKEPPAEVRSPANPASPKERVDSDATPKALPRSRTTSFLPRPVNLQSIVSNPDLVGTARVHSPHLKKDPKHRAMPSKIPTPSPPLSERRGPSPRQHLSQYPSIEEKHASSSYAFAGNSDSSPSKTARSRTTPNLVKATTSPQPANFMAPRRPGSKRPTTFPAVQKPALQENIPTSQRVNQRHSQLQQKTSRRESLAASSTITNRRSFVTGSPLAPSKQSNRGASMVPGKRMSSNLTTQAPVIASMRSSELVVATAQVPVSVASSGSTEQPRPVNPRKSPIQTPPSVPSTAEGAGADIAPPRSHADRESQRKTLGTPNGLGGVWRSSRALAAANHEVRLPRSSTFHNFGRSWEPAPPVPPIPDQYRTPSLPHLFQFSLVQPDNSHRAQHLRMVSDAASCESIPEEKRDGASPRDSASFSAEHSPIAFLESSVSMEKAAAKPPLRRSGSSSPASLATGSFSSQTSLLRSQSGRPWSISDYDQDSANVEPLLQVRDYMPPLYWAGRFQSRFDQWRTEAMHAELNPKHRTEGQLGECKLSQEKMAACYIFAQLRDLCLTGQAADSLWVSICYVKTSN
jgi:hypothetical protein